MHTSYLRIYVIKNPFLLDWDKATIFYHLDIMSLRSEQSIFHISGGIMWDSVGICEVYMKFKRIFALYMTLIAAIRTTYNNLSK